MASYFLYGVFRRNPINPLICHWDVRSGVKPTFKLDGLKFLVTEPESFELIREFQAKPVAYRLCWIVQRGGKVYDRLHAVEFFHPTPAMMWKLSRV